MLACIIFLAVQSCIRSTKQAIKNKQYEEKRRIDNFNSVLQFQLEYRVRELPWEFEDKMGMDMNIIANIMSARYDNVQYDPEVYCAGGLKSTAENAVISYLLKQEGYNVNPDEHRKKGVDIELSIPKDYFVQGRLYLLRVMELEELTGLNYERLFQKFMSINSSDITYHKDWCNERVKGIMIRYQMEYEGRQFFGMQDHFFINDVMNYKVNDRFNLDDCKNWGTPLQFAAIRNLNTITTSPTSSID